jgi:hypothetical protein
MKDKLYFTFIDLGKVLSYTDHVNNLKEFKMNKTILALVAFGLAVNLQAGTVSCDFPVYKSEPIWKTVIKKIPQKQCWDEEQKSSIDFKQSGTDCTTSGIVVAKKCTVTKCKTVYESYEEKVLVGYKNYAKCGCAVMTKISNCKLKSIKANVSY